MAYTTYISWPSQCVWIRSDFLSSTLLWMIQVHYTGHWRAEEFFLIKAFNYVLITEVANNNMLDVICHVISINVD